MTVALRTERCSCYVRPRSRCCRCLRARRGRMSQAGPAAGGQQQAHHSGGGVPRSSSRRAGEVPHGQGERLNFRPRAARRRNDRADGERLRRRPCLRKSFQPRVRRSLRWRDTPGHDHGVALQNLGTEHAHEPGRARTGEETGPIRSMLERQSGHHRRGRRERLSRSTRAGEGLRRNPRPCERSDHAREGSRRAGGCSGGSSSPPTPRSATGQALPLTQTGSATEPGRRKHTPPIGRVQPRPPSTASPTSSETLVPPPCRAIAATGRGPTPDPPRAARRIARKDYFR